MKENANVQNPVSLVIKEMKSQNNYLSFHNRQSGKNQKVSQLQMLPGGGVTDSHKMPVGV